MRAVKPTPASGHITAMRFQEHNQERVNIFVDEEFALAVPALEAARLKVGQLLSDADLARLQALGEQQLVYDKAVGFLAFRPRSEAEMRRYLRDKGVDEAQAAVVLDKLRAAGYVDDRAFARWWVENRTQFNPRGAFALRQELRLKGIAEALIAEAIAENQPDAEGTIERVAATRARRLAGEERTAFRRKLSSFLLRRGFAYEDIAPVVEKWWQTLEREREANREGERE